MLQISAFDSTPGNGWACKTDAARGTGITNRAGIAHQQASSDR